MFAKSTISQSVIDSVNGVLVESDKKLLLEPQKKEPVLSPFSKGYKPAETPTSSHTSKKVSTGTVYTKNYKAEKDVKEEVEELDELSKTTLGSYAKKASLDSVMRMGKAATDGDHKEAEKAGKRYGNVAKAIDRLTKEEVEELDELSKKTLGSYIKKSSQNAAGQTFDAAHKLGVRAMNGPAMQDKDNPHGDILAKQVRTHFDKANSRLGGISKATDKLTREEKEGSHEDEKQDKALFKKLYKKAEDKDDKSEKETPDAHTMKSEGSFDRENREERRREHEAEYEVEKRVTKNREAAKAAAQAKKPVKEERHLSPEESAEKERIAKGMKKGMAGFKERYGNRAKNVMYATATKQAMKEDKEDKEPSFTGSHQGKTTIKHIKNPTVQQRMFAHDIKPGIAGYRDRIAVLKDAERMGNLKKEEVEELDELNKDTLHSYAKKAEVDQDKQFTKIGKAIRDNDPETGNKAGHKFSKRSIGLTKAYGKLEKEEVEHLDELGELPEAKKLSKTVDTLKGPTKVPTSYDNQHKSYKVELSAEETDPPFDKPYHNTGEVKKDKYGNVIKNVAKHLAKQGMKQPVKEGKSPENDSVPFVQNANTSSSPMGLAKELAQKSFKKIRNETLMGKAGATSEEKK